MENILARPFSSPLWNAFRECLETSIEEEEEREEEADSVLARWFCSSLLSGRRYRNDVGWCLETEDCPSTNVLLLTW